jgi:hypothetical protein
MSAQRAQKTGPNQEGGAMTIALRIVPLLAVVVFASSAHAQRNVRGESIAAIADEAKQWQSSCREFAKAGECGVVRKVERNNSCQPYVHEYASKGRTARKAARAQSNIETALSALNGTDMKLGARDL